MNKILLASEISNYKDIGQKIDLNKVNTIIEEVQITNLKEVLGDKFYFDLIGNLDNPNYQDLLSGSTFEYCGVTYHQDGIKALLADYFMAKYVLVINTNFTPFGATVKQSNDSEPVDRNSLKDYSNFQSQLASSRLEIIKHYLNANPSIFPNWNNNISTSDYGLITGRRFRFKKL